MEILKIILIVLLLGLACGGIYYYRLISSFKKFILFEKQIRQNPNDALIKQYMIQYKKTFFPKVEKLLLGRARFYHAIRESNQVSYETKKELRIFLESQGVNLLNLSKTKDEIIEDNTEIE